MRRSPRSTSPSSFILAALFFVAGCGLFDPQDPPSPGIDDEQLHLPDLTASVDSALFSLVSGIETKSLQLYQHALAESSTVTDAEFHAFFDPQDIADYSQTSTPPTDWTSRDEKTFFSQFTTVVPVDLTVVLTADTLRPDVPNPDETILYRHYRITFAGSEYLAAGLADLYFRRVGVNQEWKLIRWIDRRDTVAIDVRTYGRQRLGPPSP